MSKHIYAVIALLLLAALTTALCLRLSTGRYQVAGNGVLLDTQTGALYTPQAGGAPTQMSPPVQPK